MQRGKIMKKALCTLLAVVMAMGTSSVALAKDETLTETLPLLKWR